MGNYLKGNLANREEILNFWIGNLNGRFFIKTKVISLILSSSHYFNDDSLLFLSNIEQFCNLLTYIWTIFRFFFQFFIFDYCSIWTFLCNCSNYSVGLGVTARAMSHFFGFEYYNLPIIKIRDKRSAIKKSASNSVNILVVLVFFFLYYLCLYRLSFVFGQ